MIIVSKGILQIVICRNKSKIIFYYSEFVQKIGITEDQWTQVVNNPRFLSPSSSCYYLYLPDSRKP